MTNDREQPRRSVRLLAVLLGALMILLGVEAALRVADRLDLVGYWQQRRMALNHSIWMAADVPGLIYQHRPDYHRDGVRHTERAGILRPDDVPEQAEPGTFRIALVGDSVAASIYLDHAQRTPALLETRLNSPAGGRHVELLNFGVNGYSTQQEAIQTETLVARYHPDMLLLQYCMNDFYTSERPQGWFVKHSSLYTVDYVAGLVERYRTLGYPPLSYWDNLYRTDQHGAANVRDGFARIAAYAQRRHIPVLMAIYPVISHEGWLAGDAARRHAQVSEWGQAAGFDVIDLLPDLAAHDVDSVRDKPWDTFHLNAEGQRIVAQPLGARLQHYLAAP